MPLRRLTLCLSAAILVACGGGKEDKPAPEPAPVPETTTKAETETPPIAEPLPEETGATAPIVETVKLSPAENGAKFYKKCVACHLESGKGVPNSFPDLTLGLDSLSESEAGREYLIRVIKYGVGGPLETPSGTYRGIMPGQSGGKKASDIADLLNYVMTAFYPDQQLAPFEVGEIDKVLDSERMNYKAVAASRPE